MISHRGNNNRILLVNDHSARFGIGKYVFHLYDEFLQLDHEEYSYHLLLQSMKKYYSPSTQNTIVQHRPSWLRQKGFGRTYDLLAHHYFPRKIPEGFSLYHISSQMMGKSADYVSPAVVTCHDLIDFKVESNYPALNKYLRQPSIASITKADGIIFISKHTREDFFSLFNYKEENTTIIHHAASNIFHPRDKWRSREELGLPLNRPIVLYIGSEAPRKNIETLLSSIHRVKKQIPDILLVRVGTQKKRSRNLIEKLCLEKNILYFNNQLEEALAKFYNAADMFVFPSLYEGFGLPALEALKSGCPVVASNATSIPEITGNAAILHHPLDVDAFVDSIETLLSNKSMREEYRRKGIERAMHFSWKKTAHETLEIYRKILET